MKKPMIALTCRQMPNRGGNPVYYDNQSYFQAILLTGGIPVLLPPLTGADAIAAALKFDGLLITGGEDCDPSLYGHKNTHSDLIQPEVEQGDLQLYHSFAAAGRPVLGICRGIQVINVAEGGTLVQDIQDLNPHYLQHNQRLLNPAKARGEFSHQVLFVKGSRLAEIYGDSYGVNSFHHQCIDRPAAGFLVSARSEDGIIEGIEKDRILAVQWHPEELTADARHRQLFADFVQQCQSSAQ